MGKLPMAPQMQNSPLRRLALLAYPDRVCRRRASDPKTGVMVGGGGVRLAHESVVHNAEFFVALDARHDQRSQTREALVRIASAIDVQWLEELFPRQVRTERALHYDESRQRVVGSVRQFYRDLLLRDDPHAAVDPVEAGKVLAGTLAPRAGEIFGGDEESAEFLARVALLRKHMPEHPWPPFDDAQLREILTDACAGKRSLDELRQASLAAALMQRLPYPLDRLIDQHAPRTIEVPSGNRIRVQYSPIQPPTLAARIQELFGWHETPRIAGGRVPIVLHLLGPNFRPVQVTDDLRSFWTNTYPQVRKDLRARYPKHAWPEDALTAKAQVRGHRR